MTNVDLSTLGAVIKAAYEGQADTNAFTDAEKAQVSQGTAARAAVAITAGAISIALDARVYGLQLTEDVSSVAFTGADSPADTVYGAEIEVTAPDAGGPFTLSMPTGAVQFGGVGTSLEISAGDPPALVSLRTLADGSVAYSINQAEAPA